MPFFFFSSFMLLLCFSSIYRMLGCHTSVVIYFLALFFWIYSLSCTFYSFCTLSSFCTLFLLYVPQMRALYISFFLHALFIYLVFFLKPLSKMQKLFSILLVQQAPNTHLWLIPRHLGLLPSLPYQYEFFRSRLCYLHLFDDCGLCC